MKNERERPALKWASSACCAIELFCVTSRSAIAKRRFQCASRARSDVRDSNRVPLLLLMLWSLFQSNDLQSRHSGNGVGPHRPPFTYQNGILYRVAPQDIWVNINISYNAYIVLKLLDGRAARISHTLLDAARRGVHATLGPQIYTQMSTEKCIFLDKRVREISRFFVAPRREFAPAIWRVSRTLLSRNTSTSVCPT